MFAWLGVHVKRGVCLVEYNIGRLDDEFAAVRHGVAGVDRQVDHHLVHLRGVGFDMPKIVG